MKYYIYGLYKKNTKYKKNSIDEHLFYIGITDNKNLYFRKSNHKREKFNPHKLNIINKYDFILKIFWETKNKQEAEEKEEFLIRWFGKTSNGGILVNVLDSAKDTKYAISNRSEATKNKISKALKKINENKEFRIANRDRNLTVPYNEVIEIIEEWKKNPLESQKDFANRKGISRSKFKDWLRLYSPESIGLTKKRHREIFDSAFVEGEKPKQTIQRIMNNTGWTYNKSKGLYYRMNLNK